MVKIKICGLKRLEDIELANRYKIDYAGFVFAESKRKVNYVLAKQMKEKLCEDIQSVGVFVDADTDEILKLYNDGIIDMAQLHGMESEDYIKTLKEKTNGGFDKVIECCGNSAAVSEAMMLVKNGGKIILVGVSTEPVTVPLVVSVMGVVTMLGSIAYSEFDFDKVIELIKNKDLNVVKYIDKVVSLEEVEDACKELTSGESSAIKILIDPSK